MADRDVATTPALGSWVVAVLAWLPVTLPLLWGMGETLKKAAILFR